MGTCNQESKADSKSQPDSNQVKNFLTVKQFAEKHSAFTENTLRWLIFNRSMNGFDVCFRKVGKRVLIEEKAFLARIDSARMEA